MKMPLPIKSELVRMSMILDDIQESNEFQSSKELMWEIGEAIGHINNAIDILEAK